MAKLPRKSAKVFGSSAPANAIATFGSLAAGAAARTSGASADPAVIQSLAQYLTGWTGAITGGNSPALEDMNALCYLFAYQIAYAMQTGVPEYDSATTYYIGSVVNDGVGGLYLSLTDTNVGNALTSLTNWRSLNADVVNNLVTGTSTPYSAVAGPALTTDIFWNTAGVDKVVTLPTAVGIPGKAFFIKKTDTGTGKITVNTTSSQTIDGDTSLIMRRQYDVIHVVSDGTNWQVKDLLISALFTSTLLNTATVAPSISVICIRRKGRMVDLIMPLDINPPTNKPNTSKPITAAALPTDFWPAGFPTSFAWNMPYPYNIAGTTPSGGASPQAFGCLQIFVSSGADDGKLQFAPAPGGSFSSGIQWNLWPFFCTYYLGTY